MRKHIFRIWFTALCLLTACISNGDILDLSGDLRSLPITMWDREKAAHLLERAGFGSTPEEIDAFANMSMQEAVARLVRFSGIEDDDLPDFQHSGVFDTGLDPFPPSRPATTELAKANGQALGIEVKPSGNRPIQPVVNNFFYWLRASRLETDRVAYWWANRMLTSNKPLQEKLALFWHGHFATNEDKVRDYRKMLRQIRIFHEKGMGDFENLLQAISKDPAMLTFLDAGVNIKGSPNENFAREIMELFTMGEGNYSERDIREAARAFTGWNFRGLDFNFIEDEHDTEEKYFLGNQGNFDGDDVIAIIAKEQATSDFIASKIYQYFVRDNLDLRFKSELGILFREVDLNITSFLEIIFQSRDFYSDEAIATRIKSPVELVISTYRKMNLSEIPGIPDFNSVTGALGQRLLHPPTVAGWSQGRSWITPGLLFDRGNFVLDVVFHDIGFIPPDRFGGYQIRNVHKNIRAGKTISEATKPAGLDFDNDEMMAASNLLADRDEAFNTRYGSYRGWQMATERVIPIPRSPARLNLAKMILQEELQTPEEVVDYFANRFLSVRLSDETRNDLSNLLLQEIGTRDVRAAATYLEDPLRLLLHVLLSMPEYQLG